MKSKDVHEGTDNTGKNSNHHDQSCYIHSKKNLITYGILVGVRIILTLIPQRGYIHPDEFFQSIEVIAGDRFDIDVYKPWEFNSTFPIRSPLISQLTVGIPYTILNIITPYLWYYLQISVKTPYILLVFPRLVFCGLSFLTDYSLYRICRIYGVNYASRLIIYASSYVMIVYATHTLSNSIELILFALLIYYVSRCMVYSENIVLQSDRILEHYERAENIVDRVKYYKLRASLPAHSLNDCLIITSIVVIGIFNRPTFVVFALPPIFFWLRRGLGSRSVNFWDFHTRILIFILYTIPVIIFMIITDSFYFGYLTLGEVINLNFGINNFVVTPLNFLKYNSQIKNLASHGLHSRYLHFFVNIPLLFNVLGIIALLSLTKMIYCIAKSHWLKLPRIQSVESLMKACIFIPIGLLSIFPHQEPRFIIPVILPLAYVYTPAIQPEGKIVKVFDRNGSKPINQFHNSTKISKLSYCWWICNIVLVIFYGFIHQGGVFPLANHLSKELRAKPELMHIHLHTSYMYPLPTAFLQLRNTKKIYITSAQHEYKLKRDFFLYEHGSASITDVFNSIFLIAKSCEKKFKIDKVPYRIYYALPVHYFSDFNSYSLINRKNNLDFEIVDIFYPHLSTETFTSVKFDLIECIFIEKINVCVEQVIFNFSERLRRLVRDFGLLIVRIQLSDTYLNSTRTIGD